MKKSLLIILLALTSSAVYSQDSSTPSQNEMSLKTNKHLIGVHAGVSTGIGLSYKFIHNNFGIQLTGIPILNNENIWTSAGGALSYRVKTTEVNKEPLSFLIYGGLHHLYSSTAAGTVEFTSEGIQEFDEINSQFNTGVGFGLEYTTEDTFMINVMAGYGLILESGARTTLAVEIGIHYKI